MDRWTPELRQEYEHIRTSMPDHAAGYYQLIVAYINALDNDRTNTIHDSVNGAIWLSPGFDDANKHLIDEMHSDRYPAMVKGGPLCPNARCTHRDNTITVFIQTRSADEPETVFNICRSCNRKWS